MNLIQTVTRDPALATGKKDEEILAIRQITSLRTRKTIREREIS